MWRVVLTEPDGSMAIRESCFFSQARDLYVEAMSLYDYKQVTLEKLVGGQWQRVLYLFNRRI